MAIIRVTSGKKVPIPGVSYSSQVFEATMEVVISEDDARDPQRRREHFSKLFKELLSVVDEQIAQAQLPGTEEIDWGV